jgi:hypothetical protein
MTRKQNIKNRRHLEASLKSEYKGWTDFLAVAEPLLHLASLHLQQLAELHQARVRRLHIVKSSVVDPDPYVFGPPGSASGSVSHKYGSGSGSFHHQATKKIRKTLPSTVL